MKCSATLKNTPSAQLTFEFLRPTTNDVGTAVAPLVAGSSLPRYELPWAVQQAKGRWLIFP